MSELQPLLQRVGLDGSGFMRGADQVVNKFTQMGLISKDASGKMALSGAMTGAAWAAAAVAVGVALYKIGSAFDEAFDSIRIATGETGADLEDLEESFKKVVVSVPTDFKRAADAISLIHQRLGLTGGALEETTVQLLELSRLTKTDVSAVVDSAAKLFGSWSIKTSEQTARLNELFRASQRSGITVGELSTQMTTQGGVLRTLGFSFRESAGLIALLNQNGIQSGPVFMAMGRGIAKAAEAGQEAGPYVKGLFDKIAAGVDDTEAAGLAAQTFGTRAGPKLAAAIRSGKLAYEDFAKALGKGDTIKKAASATDDLAEKLTVFKNKALVALQPFASGAFNVIVSAFSAVADVLTPVVEGFGMMVKAIGSLPQEVLIALGIGLFIVSGALDTVAAAAIRAGAAIASSPIGMIAVGLTVVAGLLGVFGGKQSEAAKETEAFTKALKDSEGAISGQAEELFKSQLENSGLTKALGKTGIAYETLREMIQSVGKVSKEAAGWIDRDATRLGIAKEAVDDFADGTKSLGNTYATVEQAQANYNAMLDEMLRDLKAMNPEVGKFAAQLAEQGQLTPEIALKLRDMALAHADLTQKQKDAIVAGQEVALVSASEKAAFELSATAAKDYKAALDILNGGGQSLYASNISNIEATRGLTEAWAAAHGDLSLGTAESLALGKQLGSAGTAAATMAANIRAAGGSVEEANVPLQELTYQILTMGTQAGKSPAQIALMLQAAGLLSKGAADGITNMDQLTAAIKKIGPATKETAEGVKEHAEAGGKTVGKNMALGTAAGIRNHTSEVADAAVEMVNKAKAAADRAARNRSPSRLFAESGRNISLGLAAGITQEAGASAAALQAAVAQAHAAANMAGPGLGISIPTTMATGGVSVPSLSSPSVTRTPSGGGTMDGAVVVALLTELRDLLRDGAGDHFEQTNIIEALDLEDAARKVGRQTSWLRFTAGV